METAPADSGVFHVLPSFLEFSTFEVSRERIRALGSDRAFVVVDLGLFLATEPEVGSIISIMSGSMAVLRAERDAGLSNVDRN